MNLFELKDNKLIYSPEALALAPFKTIFDRDESKDKAKAIAELAALYYLVDFKSDFQNILDEQLRLKEVVSVLPELGKDWKPDAKWVDAVEFYKSRQETPVLKLIQSAKIGASKLEKFFNMVDLAAVDKSGKPKYNPKQLAETIKMMPDLTASLSKLEEQVKKEIEQKANQLRGGREKGAFAD